MYHIEIRKVTVHIYSILKSLRKTAILVAISHSSIARWIHSIYPKTYSYSNKRTLKCDQIVDLLKASIICNPLTTTRNLQRIIWESTQLHVSLQLIRNVIKTKLGYSIKKARFCGRPITQTYHILKFIKKRDILRSQNRTFVSIDETAFGRFSHQCVRGYSPIGQPLYISKKVPRMDTVSVVACVTPSGLMGLKTLRNQGFNTNIFLDFLKSLSLAPGTVVLLDNVRIHHSNVVKEFCKEHDLELLYTPPYCPWFNPIEYCFSIIKRHFAKHQNVEAAFGALCPWHCRAFFC